MEILKKKDIENKKSGDQQQEETQASQSHRWLDWRTKENQQEHKTELQDPTITEKNLDERKLYPIFSGSMKPPNKMSSPPPKSQTQTPKNTPVTPKNDPPSSNHIPSPKNYQNTATKVIPDHVTTKKGD